MLFLNCLIMFVSVPIISSLFATCSRNGRQKFKFVLVLVVINSIIIKNFLLLLLPSPHSRPLIVRPQWTSVVLLLSGTGNYTQH